MWRLLNSTSRKATLFSAGIIVALGVITYFSGLSNQFLDDDIYQIVNNPPVHSLANIPSFFSGGSFYNAGGENQLVGVYFRPIMTTVYSLLYALFGPTPLAFHLLQLALHILGSIVLFLILRYSFKPILSLVLSLIFLVHPINSQAVYSIAAMQEPLFFLFGILALWLLLRFNGSKSLLLVGVCLLFSLLSKETGVLFVLMSILYLFIFDRKRFAPFLGIISIAIISYLALKIHAVGLSQNPHTAPIDNINIGARMLVIPSILLFYLGKLFFPLDLAQYYYWVYSGNWLTGLLVPVTIILGAIILSAWVLKRVRGKPTKAESLTLVFFSIWACIGVFIHLQIIPLDMTACETWFYFPMAGVLGIAGIIAERFSKNFSNHINPRIALYAAVLVICLLGARTFVRGFDWADPIALAYKNIAVSREDFNNENGIAGALNRQGDYAGARLHAQRSISIFPTASNYANLGLAYAGLGDYGKAKDAYVQGLKYQDYYLLYDNLGALTVWSSDYDTNKKFLDSSLKKFPTSGHLWLYLAVLNSKSGRNADAKAAILEAYKYGATNEYIYERVMNDEPLNLIPEKGTE